MSEGWWSTNFVMFVPPNARALIHNCCTLHTSSDWLHKQQICMSLWLICSLACASHWLQLSAVGSRRSRRVQLSSLRTNKLPLNDWIWHEHDRFVRSCAGHCCLHTNFTRIKATDDAICSQDLGNNFRKEKLAAECFRWLLELRKKKPHNATYISLITSAVLWQWHAPNRMF